MSFTGVPWSTLAALARADLGARQMPWGLYSLELHAPEEFVPRSQASSPFALSKDQRKFVVACAFFARSAKADEANTEFLGSVYGRFFQRWPSPLTSDHVGLGSTCNGPSWPAGTSIPPISWEMFVSLSDEDLLVVQDDLLARANAKLDEIKRKMPRLRVPILNVTPTNEDDNENDDVTPMSENDDDENSDIIEIINKEPLPPNAPNPISEDIPGPSMPGPKDHPVSRRKADDLYRQLKPHDPLRGGSRNIVELIRVRPKHPQDAT
ncbi:hypothetical protein H1R20_g7978, partial [Candolleomyces eurysporus]